MDQAAEAMLKKKLATSLYGDDESISGMLAAFEGRVSTCPFVLYMRTIILVDQAFI